MTEIHEHSYPIQPPDGSLTNPGDCSCGAPYSDVEKAYEAELAATEWSVYVTGLGVLIRQNIEMGDDDPANLPFDEASAREYAAWVNSEAKPIRRGAGISATLLHYGVPVDETAGV